MLSKEPSILPDFPPVAYETWRAQVEAELQGAPFERKLVSHTYEGIDVQPVYTRRDWDATGDPSGFPGLPPMTRGSELLAGTRTGWDVRQEHLHPDPAEVNAAALEDLARGVTSLHLRFDAAARNGQTADQRSALVGRDGVMLYTVSDLDRALRNVHLDMISLGLEAGAAAVPAAAMLVHLYRQRGHDLRTIRAHFHADPLAVLARDGRLPTHLPDALAATADLAAWTHANTPRSRAIRVGTGPYHHAGATAAQDLGLSMATGLAYLRANLAAGLDVNAAAGQLVFSYSIGCNFFLAIAKLRAARRLWARIVTAAGGSDDAAAMCMQVRTSKRVLTTRDPWVNMLRGTVCCFAGAVAGAQVIIAEPFDVALGQPGELGRRIARNTQIILSEEAHLHRVADPAGGSWYLEKLTDELADRGWAFMQQIEKQGGMAKALEAGWVNEQIASAFAPRLKNIATRRDPLTGVSEFPNLAETLPEPWKPDLEALAAASRKRLASGPDTASLNGLLSKLAACEPGRGALMDSTLEAVAAGANISQVAGTLWTGATSSTVTPIHPHPYAEPFEHLRSASDQHLALTGARPRICLVQVGSPAHHSARAGYSRNFFEAGGFEVRATPAVQTADDAAAAFSKADANIAVVCSSDKLYDTLAEPVAKALKAGGARTVILAGAPGSNEARFRAAGVDRFIYIKCDVLATLRELLTEEGVLA